MKTKNRVQLLAVSAAALLLNVSTSSGQVFDSVEALNNRAVAASPRAREEFPWLTRSTATGVAPAKAPDSNIALAAVMKNRALAASPKALEEFPELSRPAQPARAADASLASTVLKNRAFASSPRAQEEFPWLARGTLTVTEETFQGAPPK